MTREEAIQAAKDVLAEETGLDVAEMHVRQIESVRWPNAGLGCPEDGRVYAAVLTPGYRVALQVSRILYRVHVGAGRAVVCGDPLGPGQDARAGDRRPERIPEKRETVVVGEVPDDILDALLNDLEERTSAGRETFDIVRAEERVWSDGSLGCGEPGAVYTHAPVRGYHVVLRHGEREYDYRAVHADFFYLCERPRVGPRRPPGPGSPRQD